MKLARDLLKKKPGLQHIIPVRCYMHAYGITMTSILAHPIIKGLVVSAQKIVTYFRAAHKPLFLLKQEAKLLGIDCSLKSSNTTRITSIQLCADSVLKNQHALKKVCQVHGNEINNNQVKLFVFTRDFWIKLDDLNKLLVPFSKAIMAIQSKTSRLSDVNRYWIYLSKCVESFCENTHYLGEDFEKHLIRSFNARTKEIPSQISSLALLLDPRYRSGVNTTNKESFTLLLTSATTIMLDAGYAREQCELLCQQIIAYAKNLSPYSLCTYGGETFNVRDWWASIPLSQEPVIVNLSKILFSITPHSAGVERTFSLFDWIQSKRRNRLSVEKI